MDKPIIIKTDKGEKVEAKAPIIISASRSTDIPAFYAKWFIDRLKAGYVVWYNPFNQKPMYISFQNCKAIVFWTKNPKPIVPLLKELDDRGISYYFQYTVNDYESEGFEPNVPLLESRIETFKELSNLIGKNKVIWRFDPIIITRNLTVREILKRIWRIGNELKGYTEKLVFSFVDIKCYRKVQRNLVKENPQFLKEAVEHSELTLSQMNEIAEGLMKIKEHWKNEGYNLELATCGEEIDLDMYGISHNRCIDSVLMKRIFAENNDLVHYISYGSLPEKGLLFDEPINIKPLSEKRLKDKGQRKTCGCMISKDIGIYNTCSHLCTYCYANTSKEVVFKNRKLHQNNSESIIK